MPENLVDAIYDFHKHNLHESGVVAKVTKAHRVNCQIHAQQLGVSDIEYSRLMGEVAEKHRQLNKLKKGKHSPTKVIVNERPKKKQQSHR